jgi:putative transposase
MEQGSTSTEAADTKLIAGEAWFDPIEAGIRDRVRGFIQELLEQELETALGRTRHERAKDELKGYRNGTRERQLLGSFGPVELSVPRARMVTEGGATKEWRSATLPRYARMTRQVEALVAGAYLAGTNTRRVKRALAALFGGAVGKDVVSRTWRKVRTDWDAWTRRDLAGGKHRPFDPGRHRRAGPAGPQSHEHFFAGGARCAPRRTEGAADGKEHGRRERGSMAQHPR